MFQPYNGPWTFEQAAHLLRRTTFGPTKARIQQALDEGFDGTLDTLFGEAPVSEPPVYFDYSDDPNAGIGETWVDKPYDSNSNKIEYHRSTSLNSWWLTKMRHENQTITRKLQLFWHNHFPINFNPYANSRWWYLEKLEAFALGNFREFTKQITVDKGMLVYLTGILNVAAEPNENYSRELLELFSIGKGDIVGPGDYSNYTELDVAALAAALTGWKINEDIDPDAYFVAADHSNGIKQLSHRFDNAVIQNSGENEYKNVVDTIFQRPEVARFICRRLYIWFVNFDITPEIEESIIIPMADILFANDYEIRPALIALLKSEHFYSESMKGCLIKNPIDLLFSLHSTFEVAVPSDPLDEYNMWFAWFLQLRKTGMAPFTPPSVAGWKAYYQKPGFYKDWINTATMVNRKKMFTSINNISSWADENLKGFDLISFVATLENPLNPNSLINEVCQLIFPRPMTDAQKTYFKNILLQGLPDFEWTDEYGAYLADPSNDALRTIIENKLDTLLRSMTDVPEFQLS